MHNTVNIAIAQYQSNSRAKANPPFIQILVNETTTMFLTTRPLSHTALTLFLLPILTLALAAPSGETNSTTISLADRDLPSDC
jgi:hypothetical protein